MRTFLVCAILVLCNLAIGCGGPGFAYRIPTANMSPTINPDDLCTANPFAYWSNPIERFDIVAFYAPESVRKMLSVPAYTRYISRVIGLPGEKIEIKHGVVYINDTVLPEPFEKVEDAMDFRAMTIPENEYFVLGDNRPNSEDSRFYRPSTIKKADIAGKIIKIYHGYYKKQ